MVKCNLRYADNKLSPSEKIVFLAPCSLFHRVISKIFFNKKNHGKQNSWH